MRYIIAPEYRHLDGWIRQLIAGDYSPDKIYCNKRNTVELVSYGPRKFVLKKYKRVGLLKGLIYTVFRKTKARRAYEYAALLREKGIGTPREVAYAEIARAGIFRDGYFLSEYVDWPILAYWYYSGVFTPAERNELVDAISHFVLRLHQAGFVPHDLNLSNIMYHCTPDGKYQFQILDINRMTTGRQPGLSAAMKSFHQMWASPGDEERLVRPYAAARGFDLQKSMHAMQQHRKKFLQRKNLKKILLRR